jgi:hypothetical protein
MPAGRPIDVSVSVRPRMPIYPGDPGVAITLAKSIERGGPANASRLAMGAHTGCGGIRTGSLWPVRSMRSSSTMRLATGSSIHQRWRGSSGRRR